MGDRVLTVGIIGAGEVATKLHLPVLSATPGINLTYVADVNGVAAKTTGESYGIESLTVTDNLSVLPVDRKSVVVGKSVDVGGGRVI